MDPYQFRCKYCRKVFDLEDVDVCDYCKEDACFVCIDKRKCCGDEDEE